MKRLGIPLTCMVICGLAEGTSGGEKGPLDRDFLVKVAVCHNAEIEISKLADKRSGSSPVKDFASMLIKEHKAAYDRLGELLNNRKIGAVTGLEERTRKEIKRLGEMEGKEFDRNYLDCMIKEHKNAIGIFENQAKNGQDDGARKYASDMLPDLRKHLSKAQELSKAIEK